MKIYAVVQASVKGKSRVLNTWKWGRSLEVIGNFARNDYCPICGKTEGIRKWRQCPYSVAICHADSFFASQPGPSRSGCGV